MHIVCRYYLLNTTHSLIEKNYALAVRQKYSTTIHTNYMTRSFLASFALNFLENILSYSYVQQIRQLNYLAYQSDFEYCLYQYPAGKMIIWFKFAKAYNSSTSLNLSTLGTSFSPRYQVNIKINPRQFSDYISIIFYQSEIVVSFC